MRLILLLCLCLLVQWQASGQKTYQEAITLGDRALQAQQFKKAINYYFAAQAFDPTKETVVKQKVSIAFREISELKKAAETAQQQATDNFERANKLLDAFYFYADRFALAQKGGKFYFIDKDGNEIEKLGKWTKAEQFRQNELLTEVYDKQAKYLIDTMGNHFKIAYSIEDFKKDKDINALDLRGVSLETIPDEILEAEHLEMLYLSGDGDKKLDNMEFLKNFKRLKYFSCSNCNVLNFSSFTTLDSLLSLDLSGTNFSKVEIGISDFPSLKKLYISYNTSLQGIEIGEGALPSLKHIKISDNRALERVIFRKGAMLQVEKIEFPYGEDGHKSLHTIQFEGTYPKLKSLNLRATALTQEQIQQLQKQLPNCKIEIE